MRHMLLFVGLWSTLGAAGAHGQSSLLRDAAPAQPTQPVSQSSASTIAYAAAPLPAADANKASSEQSLQDYSLFYVTAPKPKSYVKNDLITIIVDEQSSTTTDADADAEKKLNFNASLEHFIDLTQLYQMRLQPSPRSPIAQVDLNANPKWKAQGSYDRADKLAAKITATIIDVKPNGVLVLEAKKTITKDNEVTTIVLTGNVRTGDVTTSNTVLSSQLADLIVSMTNEGDVRDATTKGWIPRLLDTVFAF
ncbi:MAG: flagellar basal body L-ring protein FlgH [Phycisphaerae bacterium]|nr:flagellar basal body L-ring protein FlgH [Phycisphaerae bacterium]MBN8597355.1 flagellar basal body L-ring protein FlgH [Planctomycetota bacterium]